MPIFSKDWWLDAVCEKDNWDVNLVERDGRIVASMPIFEKSLFCFKGIGMPNLTQTLGPYIKFPLGQKYETALSFQKEMLQDLIEALPKTDFFIQSFNYQITNWLPFYWAGFEQKTRYTYVLEDLKDLDCVWKNFNNKLRTDIRKAEKILTIDNSDNLEAFYEINRKAFSRQNLSIPYSLEFLRKIDGACSKNSCRRIFFAVDSKENIHGGVYIVWDHNSAYYLMGGYTPELKNSNATSLLLWEAIKFSSTVVNRFDFEGSMIRPIERFFRSFGAVQKPYFHIYKYNSRLLSLLKAIKDVFKRR